MVPSLSRSYIYLRLLVTSLRHLVLCLEAEKAQHAVQAISRAFLSLPALSLFLPRFPIHAALHSPAS